MSQREKRVEEAQQLSRMLVLITEQSKADFAAIAESLGLPVHLARAVVLLSAPAPMRELAEKLGCDRSYITILADQLHERGLVERVPGADRRVKLLQLTEAGEQMRDDFAEAVADHALVLRRLDDAQRQTLRPLLEALLQDDRPVTDAVVGTSPGLGSCAPFSHSAAPSSHRGHSRSPRDPRRPSAGPSAADVLPGTKGDFTDAGL